MYSVYAMAYAKRGMAVTPLRGKRPFVDEWEKTTHETILLDSAYKNSNIGLLCGEPSGVICIDIDTPDEELEKLIVETLPPTPVMKKGKKGINYFYRYNGEKTINYKNPMSKKDMIFELISTGRQTVLPPSIHPDTKQPYIWCDKDGENSQNTLLNVDLLPVLPDDWFPKVDTIISNYCVQDKVKKDSGSAVGGIIGLLNSSDVDKPSHTDAADYNPKSIEDIPEGYRDRSRSGAHQAVTEKIMSLLNSGNGQKKVLKEIMKFDAEYNAGYPTTYYACKTCKFRHGTPEQRATAHITDVLATMNKKKLQDGDELLLPDDGEAKPSKEMQVVRALLTKFNIEYDQTTTKVNPHNSDMLIQDGDIYRYMGDGRWKMVDESDENAIKRMIQKAFGTNCKTKDIESAFKMLKIFLPSPPRGVNMHQGNPYAICLKNGTLHLVQYEDGYRVEFRDHNRSDFLVNKLELDYDPDFKDQNADFNAMLDRLFSGDSDASDKIKLVQECFGSAILPVFPKIVFFHGPPGCGKSSLILTLSNLLSNDNVGRIDPSDFKGFLLEPLIGKLVNIVTDVKDAPLEAATLKQVEDRVPFNIQRKGRKNISMPLPAFHLFGGNKLPKNFDTDTDAFERRVIFCKFNNTVTKTDGKGNFKHDRNFAHRVFHANAQGILNFAIEGIIRLCNSNGQYTQPASGWNTLQEWQNEYSSTAQFIKDIKSGEVVLPTGHTVVIRDDLTMSRASVWQVFRSWMVESGRGSKINRTMFYNEFSKHFQTGSKGNSKDFSGIGQVILGESVLEAQDTQLNDNY